MTDPTDELIRICRHLGAWEREVACCGPITVQQCVILQEVSARPHDISSLAAFSGSSKSAMTRLVDGLEKRGWAQRAPAPDDGRRVLVQLTQAGQDEARRLRGLTAGVVGGIMARIPVGERENVSKALALVREALDGLRGTEGCC